MQVPAPDRIRMDSAFGHARHIFYRHLVHPPTKEALDGLAKPTKLNDHRLIERRDSPGSTPRWAE
jgi:hypothetical protein